jgi:hypothetical protein
VKQGVISIRLLLGEGEVMLETGSDLVREKRSVMDRDDSDIDIEKM